jgi:hypothetical protein
MRDNYFIQLLQYDSRIGRMTINQGAATLRQPGERKLCRCHKALLSGALARRTLYGVKYRAPGHFNPLLVQRRTVRFRITSKKSRGMALAGPGLQPTARVIKGCACRSFSSRSPLFRDLNANLFALFRRRQWITEAPRCAQ